MAPSVSAPVACPACGNRGYGGTQGAWVQTYIPPVEARPAHKMFLGLVTITPARPAAPPMLRSSCYNCGYAITETLEGVS